MDGRSLLPFAKDPLLHSGRDLLLETPTYAAIRSPNWLYAEHVTGERELYNLARDRDELNSLHNNPALDSIKTNLAMRLARLRGCKGAACRRGAAARARDEAPASPRAELVPLDAFLYRVGGPSSRKIARRRLLHRRASAEARPPPAVHGARPEALREAGRLAGRGPRHADRLAPPDARAPHRRLRLLATARHIGESPMRVAHAPGAALRLRRARVRASRSTTRAGRREDHRFRPRSRRPRARARRPAVARLPAGRARQRGAAAAEARLARPGGTAR